MRRALMQRALLYMKNPRQNKQSHKTLQNSDLPTLVPKPATDHGSQEVYSKRCYVLFRNQLTPSGSDRGGS